MPIRATGFLHHRMFYTHLGDLFMAINSTSILFENKYSNNFAVGHVYTNYNILVQPRNARSYELSDVNIESFR